jgi:hypothetical protein
LVIIGSQKGPGAKTFGKHWAEHQESSFSRGFIFSGMVLFGFKPHVVVIKHQ